jgi:HK97 family phage major capsid protein
MMDMKRVEALREERVGLVEKMVSLTDAAEKEERDLTDEERDEFDASEKRVGEIDPEIRRHETVVQLRPHAEQADVLETAEPEQRFATAKGGRSEQVYRADNSNGLSFFRDLYQSSKGDHQASERLARHDAETRAANTTGSTDGGGFIPPVFLGDFYAEFAREGRPFADTVPNLPLMATGMTLTIPRVTTGVTVADQGATENAAVSTTAIVDSPLSVPVRTIAGYNDVSQQLLDRSEPGIDQIIFADLRAAYDSYLDTQLLSGSGTNAHTGIRAVSSINTVQYTDGSPTAAELTPKLYDALQKIATNRHRKATHFVMHPRRAAWLASNLSSTFPLFQQGGFVQAAGSQDRGFVMTIGGLPVVEDANIGVTYSDGGSTNEDEIYAVYAPDLMLWEGTPQVRVDPYTVGLNLTVRIVLFGYSAFASGRFAKSITKVYGSGLATPTF